SLVETSASSTGASTPSKSSKASLPLGGSVVDQAKKVLGKKKPVEGVIKEAGAGLTAVEATAKTAAAATKAATAATKAVASAKSTLATAKATGTALDIGLAEAGLAEAVATAKTATAAAKTATAAAKHAALVDKVGGAKVSFLPQGTISHLAKGFGWAMLAYTAINALGPALGLSPEATKSLASAAGGGMAAATIAQAIGANAATSTGLASSIGAYAGPIGWIVGGLIFAFSYKKTKQQLVAFSCLPWQPQQKGNDCTLCNNRDIPCSQYQCKSLGQACELVNAGTDEEKCDWVNRFDSTPPFMEPLESALLDNYRYTPDGAVSPPNRGVKILYENSQDNCIPAFTPLKLGVEITKGGGEEGKEPEPAACKIDTLRQNTFEEMRFFLSGGLLKYNHTYSLSLP
ncbi:MAG: hypothetical protein QGI60_05470, partial [archaeon]|nr:hypothetical protein [archaeon]